MPANFTTLNSNEIYSVLRNMVISQTVFTDNIAGGTELVDKARVDGTLYGDTKTYISTDVLRSHAWGNDAEASNLLNIERAPDPKVQSIVLNIFRQIPLTTDNYLTKRAFMNEGTFILFNSTLKGWLSDTKKVYDMTLYNSFIGTDETNNGKQRQTVTLQTLTGITAPSEKNQAYQLRALEISREIENLGDDMAKPNRFFNDYGFLRSVAKSSITILMNSKYANEFSKIDIKGIFHNENIVPEAMKLHKDYFGTKNTSSGTTTASNTTIRSLIEKDFNEDSDGNLLNMNDENYDPSKHIFPGDLWPNSTAYEANTTYTVDENIICKIIGGPLPPYLSAFSVQTAFFNPRSLTETQFLTFGHNTLEHLMNYAFVTIREAQSGE
jgi:hypothetical protein